MDLFQHEVPPILARTFLKKTYIAPFIVLLGIAGVWFWYTHRNTIRQENLQQIETGKQQSVQDQIRAIMTASNNQTQATTSPRTATQKQIDMLMNTSRVKTAPKTVPQKTKTQQEIYNLMNTP